MVQRAKHISHLRNLPLSFPDHVGGLRENTFSPPMWPGKETKHSSIYQVPLLPETVRRGKATNLVSDTTETASAAPGTTEQGQKASRAVQQASFALS